MKKRSKVVWIGVGLVVAGYICVVIDYILGGVSLHPAVSLPIIVTGIIVLFASMFE